MILNQAGALAGQTKDPELTQKYAELALAQKWDNQTRNMTVPEMQQELLNVAKGVAVGGVSPEQAKKFEGVLKNRIDWANKDGFAFYQLQNPTTNVVPLPTPNDPQEVIQSKVQSRAAAASAASELQGKPVAPVTAGELQAVFQNWNKLSFKQQEQQLRNEATKRNWEITHIVTHTRHGRTQYVQDTTCTKKFQCRANAGVLRHIQKLLRQQARRQVLCKKLQKHNFGYYGMDKINKRKSKSNMERITNR